VQKRPYYSLHGLSTQREQKAFVTGVAVKTHDDRAW
jgi:hypothetical protein